MFRPHSASHASRQVQAPLCTLMNKVIPEQKHLLEKRLKWAGPLPTAPHVLALTLSIRLFTPPGAFP